MLKTGYIYKITNPVGCIYIGQTYNIAKRVKFYKLGHCKGQVKLYRSILKYGWENHLFVIVKSIDCNRNHLNEFERQYIKYFDSFNTINGLNLTAGGEGSDMSDESKMKLRIARTGKVMSEETKNKLRLANVGKRQSIETIEKRRAKIKGLKRNATARKNISNGRKGIQFSESHIQSLRDVIRPRLSESRKENMRQYMLKAPHKLNSSKKVIDILTKEVFSSLKDACARYGYKYHFLQDRLRGRVVNKTNLEWV